MAEQQSDNRPRQQGGGNRRNNNNNHRRRPSGDDRSRNDRDTYGRSGGSSDYTPPSEQQRKTFGGGEYERVYRDKPVAKKPLGQRILGFLSFGLLGKDKPAGKTNGPAKGRSDSGGRGDNDRGAGQSRRGGERRERPERSRDSRDSRPPARRSENGDNPERRQPSREPRERAPQALDLDAIIIPRLHIGNLSYDTVESDLFGLFNGVGKVLNAEIVTHSRTQRSKGFGFVQFATVEEAKRAATELHGKPFMGRSIIVGPAKGLKPERGNQSEEDAEDEIRPAPLNMD